MGLIVAMSLAIYVNKKIDKRIDESLFTMVGSDSATKLYYYEMTDEAGA